MEWTSDYEQMLEKIRINSVNQATLHKKKYFFYMKLNKWFRIPTIILSSIGSVTAVGLQAYLQQSHVSSLTCLISLTIGIINSIEIFLKINENCESELEASKEFYKLATDIHKTLGLTNMNRGINAKESLDEVYRRYVELMHTSNLILNYNIKDVLITLPKNNKSIFTKLSLSPKEDLSSSNSSLNSDSSNPLTGVEINLERTL